MEDLEKENQVKKPTFKEMVLDYKDKTVGPIVKLFNVIYVVTTLLAYFYYVFYVITYIYKNGTDSTISILLMVAVGIYTLILVACAIISSSIKTAKKRIRKALKAFRFFKRSITIVSSVVAVMALISTLQAENTSGWAVFVSIFSLVTNFIKIMFSILTMGISAGTSVLKFGAKASIKYYKKQKAKKKAAPEIDSNAAIENQNPKD